MKFSYSRTVLFVSLCLPLSALARHPWGRYKVVTVYEDAPPVYVTSYAFAHTGQNDVPLSSPTSSFIEASPPLQTVTPVEDVEDTEPEDTETNDFEKATPTYPTLRPTGNLTALAENPTPTSAPAAIPTPVQGNVDSSGASLTIKITNQYGTPLSVSVGSNYGCPTPDGNPQPTSISSSVSYTFPVSWAGRISVGKSLSGCNSLIEASYDPNWYPSIDISYVDGYSVPITCSVEGRPVTGCNIELFDQGIECDSPMDNGACPNSARSKNRGPAAPFFAACQGSAYTYPQDDTATYGSIPGREISCCIGTSCPTPPMQKSQKRDVPLPGPLSKREYSAFDRSQHLHQHQERHRLMMPRSHAYPLIADAKPRR